ncbi:conjugal transfer protein [Ralstonia solanacearum]|uniref:VirB3 family type IV secretion system protein n=1 Tax=Ralstonia solanacearum TaxID=305 RepID=UPI0005AC034A|nr:VirB3 family type IV secretion system protein [Ralstonia solanacearum]MDC6179992.1 VirB3 family type IV secretion system protein [Ralstonia solanacearum]MDC6239637.1 VirB3 family type IV secretion system protein [Ralstonia solanacearum]TYZ56059.1 conjugal transfer protein [Ralstonia solanacearum]
MRQHKVSRSLSLPRMIGGVVRGFAIANGTLTAVLVYITYQAGWQFIVGFLALGMVSHMALRWLTNKDPWWNQILTVYDRYGDLYEPGPWHGKLGARFRRPYGFDSDLPC